MSASTFKNINDKIKQRELNSVESFASSVIAWKSINNYTVTRTLK